MKYTFCVRYSFPGFSVVHFLDYAQLKNSRKWVFGSKIQVFNRKIEGFSKVYWSKPIGIKAEIPSFHWYCPEFLKKVSFRWLWVFGKVDKKKACRFPSIHKCETTGCIFSVFMTCRSVSTTIKAVNKGTVSDTVQWKYWDRHHHQIPPMIFWPFEFTWVMACSWGFFGDDLQTHTIRMKFKPRQPNCWSILWRRHWQIQASVRESSALGVQLG